MTVEQVELYRARRYARVGFRNAGNNSICKYNNFLLCSQSGNIDIKLFVVLREFGLFLVDAKGY